MQKSAVHTDTVPPADRSARRARSPLATRSLRPIEGVRTFQLALPQILWWIAERGISDYAGALRDERPGADVGVEGVDFGDDRHADRRLYDLRK